MGAFMRLNFEAQSLSCVESIPISLVCISEDFREQGSEKPESKGAES